MNILKPLRIEDAILTSLRTGSQSTHVLQEKVHQLLGPITKQGFYASLRKLKKDEVVVIYRKEVALNTLWLRDMRLFVDEASDVYFGTKNSFDPFLLSDKESISYVFLSTNHLDIFWGHVQSILVANSAVTEPIYSYDSHYWLYFARQDSEQKLLEDFTKQQRQFLMTVGSSTALDKCIKSKFSGEYLQYYMSRPLFDTSYYVTVVGDYVIEIHLDSKIAKKIDSIYQQHATSDLLPIRELKGLLSGKSKNRFRLSRNRKKAEELKRKFKKHFYIIQN